VCPGGGRKRAVHRTYPLVGVDERVGQVQLPLTKGRGDEVDVELVLKHVQLVMAKGQKHKTRHSGGGV